MGLQPVWTQRTRVDRHGLWIKPGRILGVTARSLREAIERAPQVHLCRSEECLQESAFHCKAYAAIDADAVIDLGAYRRLNSWRMLVLCCRGARTCRRSTGRYLRCCFSRRSTEAPRQIQDQGVARVLDPDSESEAEVVSDTCEAVLVGLELQGKPRALTPEGCEDLAATEPTRLLDDDLQLSDLGGKECARLCNHHSQLYMLSCQGRKCSVVSCFSKVHGAHRGTPSARSTSLWQARPPHLGARAQNLRSPSSNLFVDRSRLRPREIPDPVALFGSWSKAPLLLMTQIPNCLRVRAAEGRAFRPSEGWCACPSSVASLLCGRVALKLVPLSCRG